MQNIFIAMARILLKFLEAKLFSASTKQLAAYNLSPRY